MYRIFLVLSIQLIAFTAYSQTWSLSGNSGTTPGTHFLGTVDLQRLVFKTNSTERMSIDGNGTETKLSIAGDLNTNLRIDFSASGTAFHRITSHANNGFLDIIAGTNTGGHSLRFFTDNSERGRITPTGDWQIGTPTNSMINFAPTLSRVNDRIRIGGHINPTDGQNILLSTSSDGGATYKRIIVERDGWFGFGTANTTNLGWTVGNPALRFTPDGRMMIASTQFFFGREGGPYNCSSLFTYVSNENEWNVGAGNYPTGQNYYYFGTILQTPEATTKRAPLYIGGRELKFMIGGAGNIGQPGIEALKISEGGDVGIGTSNPQSKLAVNGTVTASKLKITQIGWPTWPDYVFHKSYELPSLEFVERYIREHKHLPDVPSAEEVEKNGLDVGDNQAILLKKIEELTLYIIEQNKKIDEMKVRFEKVEKRSEKS